MRPPGQVLRPLCWKQCTISCVITPNISWVKARASNLGVGAAVAEDVGGEGMGEKSAVAVVAVVGGFVGVALEFVEDVNFLITSCT